MDQWATIAAAAKAPKRKGRALLGRRPRSKSIFVAINGDFGMNTAVARRLALGDRVVWLGKDGYQPTGSGTITRITAHEVEVRWQGEAVSRYRRAHLHNLRHVEVVTQAVVSAARHSRHVGSEFASAHQ
jgi:hypothetical protein